jgi:hypothetical protein
MRQKLVLSLRAGFLGDFQMNDRWGLLPIWLKLAMAAMFAVMVFFAVGSLVLGRWATALVSWAIVLAVVALLARSGCSRVRPGAFLRLRSQLGVSRRWPSSGWGVSSVQAIGHLSCWRASSSWWRA